MWLILLNFSVNFIKSKELSIHHVKILSAMFCYKIPASLIASRADGQILKFLHREIFKTKLHIAYENLDKKKEK